MAAKSTRSTTKIDYIYLIRRRDGAIKIGVSNNPESRIRSLRTADTSMQLLSTYPLRNAYDIESQFHKEYIARNVEGEWFELTTQDLYAIQRKLNDLADWSLLINDQPTPTLIGEIDIATRADDRFALGSRAVSENLTPIAPHYMVDDSDDNQDIIALIENSKPKRRISNSRLFPIGVMLLSCAMCSVANMTSNGSARGAFVLMGIIFLVICGTVIFYFRE